MSSSTLSILFLFLLLLHLFFPLLLHCIFLPSFFFYPLSFLFLSFCCLPFIELTSSLYLSFFLSLVRWSEIVQHMPHSDRRSTIVQPLQTQQQWCGCSRTFDLFGCTLCVHNLIDVHRHLATCVAIPAMEVAPDVENGMLVTNVHPFVSAYKRDSKSPNWISLAMCLHFRESFVFLSFFLSFFFSFSVLCFMFLLLSFQTHNCFISLFLSCF